jgi:hypothetical protein
VPSFLWLGARGEEPSGASWLQRALRHQPGLRLLYLGGPSTDRLAARLSARVPAALGIRDVATEEAYQCFTEEFYRALLAGHPAEAAVGRGRQAIAAQFPGGREWALPVLYLTAVQGDLLSPPDKDQRGGQEAITFAAPTTAPVDEDREMRMLKLQMLQANLEALQSQSLGAPPLSRAALRQIKEIEQDIARLRQELGLP